MDKLPYLHLEQKRETNENQEIDTERFRTSRAYNRCSHGRKPLLSYALPRHTIQSGRSKCDPSRRTNGDDSPNCWQLNHTFRKVRNQGIIYTPGARAQSHYGQLGRESCAQSHRIRPTKCTCSQRSLAECFGQRSERINIQTFFIRISARYRRIRKRPKGKPSPQLYAYKTEKLQELEALFEKEQSTSSMVTSLIYVRKAISLTGGSFPEKTFTFLQKEPNDSTSLE